MIRHRFRLRMAGQIWMMILIMMQNGLIVTQMDLGITSLDFRAMHAPMIMEKVGWMFLVAKKDHDGWSDEGSIMKNTLISMVMAKPISRRKLS